MIAELNKIITFDNTDAHVHTHLCDGKPEMTVQNIAKVASERGIKQVILTPHFHKSVSDGSTTLYDDSDQEIFVSLRNEINACDTDVKILLSTEADILDIDGHSSAATLSANARDALDAVTLTLNYHPLLPLRCVEVTYSKCIEQIYESGYYAECEAAAGGTKRVLETMYEAQINALKRADFAVIVGHFFAAHTNAVKNYSWFNAKKEHINLMKEGASALVDECAKKDAVIDLTGIHLAGDTPEQKRLRDGFWFDFQCWFIDYARKKGVTLTCGSDAHSLRSVGDIGYYNFFK